MFRLLQKDSVYGMKTKSLQERLDFAHRREEELKQKIALLSSRLDNISAEQLNGSKIGSVENPMVMSCSYDRCRYEQSNLLTQLYDKFSELERRLQCEVGRSDDVSKLSQQLQEVMAAVQTSSESSRVYVQQQQEKLNANLKSELEQQLRNTPVKCSKLNAKELEEDLLRESILKSGGCVQHSMRIKELAMKVLKLEKICEDNEDELSKYQSQVDDLRYELQAKHEEIEGKEHALQRKGKLMKDLKERIGRKQREAERQRVKLSCKLQEKDTEIETLNSKLTNADRKLEEACEEKNALKESTFKARKEVKRAEKESKAEIRALQKRVRDDRRRWMEDTDSDGEQHDVLNELQKCKHHARHLGRFIHHAWPESDMASRLGGLYERVAKVENAVNSKQDHGYADLL